MNFPTVTLNIGDEVIYQSPFKSLDKVGKNRSYRANGGRPRYGRVVHKQMKVSIPYFQSIQHEDHQSPSAEWHYGINFTDHTYHEYSQYIADRFLRLGTPPKRAGKKTQ